MFEANLIVHDIIKHHNFRYQNKILKIVLGILSPHPPIYNFLKLIVIY